MPTNYIDAKVLLDSVAPNGKRLTTFEVTMHRFVLAEFNTHRRLARNAASSRAIPVTTCIKYVNESPAMPVEWGRNQPGMQAGEQLTEADVTEATKVWLEARDAMVIAASKLDKLKVHKQLANRLIEPFRFVTIITSATEWSNFFGLRCDPQAQPEIQRAAYSMRGDYLAFSDVDELTPEFVRLAHLMEAAYEDSKPKYLDVGEWHIPMLRQDDYDQFGDDTDEHNDILRKLGVGRCARVSYLTHDGLREPEKDITLHNGLISNGHWSPLEHVAAAMGKYDNEKQSGCFYGWRQYRKNFPQEELK